MNPLMSAEQAVLGAVLLDPEQLTHLEWLAAEHFYRPVHQALFDPLRKLRNGGHPALSADGPLPLSWVTDAVEEAGQHVRRLTAAYAHTLIQACPRTEHAPVYGRMVLEGAIHRTVAHAIRLHQAARADAVQGGGLAAAGRLRRPDPRAALPVLRRAVPPGRTHRPGHSTLEGPATQSVSRRHSAERAADRRLRRHHPRRRRLLRHQVMRSLSHLHHRRLRASHPNPGPARGPGARSTDQPRPHTLALLDEGVPASALTASDKQFGSRQA